MPLKNGDFRMEINVVFLVTVLIWLMCIIIGGIKGFLKSSLSLIALILSGTLVMALNPFVTGILRDHTKLDEWLESKIERMIIGEQPADTEVEEDTVVLQQDITLPTDVVLPDGTYLPAGTVVPAGTVLPANIGLEELKKQVNDNLSTTEQSKIIEKLPVPEALRNSLEENNNAAVYKELGVENFTDYIGGFISNICLNIIGYVITFLIVFFALHILMLLFDIVDKLPVIHGINHFAGALLGIVKGFLILEILFLILIPFSAGAFGRMILTQVENNGFLGLLYHKNMLIPFLMNIVVKTL